MANLIVTVLAIALAAAGVFIGAYYGGQAFTQGLVKSYANSIVGQTSQVAAGWVVYTNENAGTAPTGISSLVPLYIQSYPKASPSVTTTDYITMQDGGNTWALLALGQTNNEICVQLDISGGNLASDAATARDGAGTVGFLKRLGCFRTTADIDADGSGIINLNEPESGEYTFYYRLK